MVHSYFKSYRIRLATLPTQRFGVKNFIILWGNKNKTPIRELIDAFWNGECTQCFARGYDVELSMYFVGEWSRAVLGWSKIRSSTGLGHKVVAMQVVKMRVGTEKRLELEYEVYLTRIVELWFWITRTVEEYDWGNLNSHEVWRKATMRQRKSLSRCRVARAVNKLRVCGLSDSVSLIPMKGYSAQVKISHRMSV